MPWERRTKAVDSMPGGVTNYFESTRWIANQVRERALSSRALLDRVAIHYSIGDEYARLSVGFLRKLGLLHDENGVCVLPDVMHAWLQHNDPTPLMVILHQRVRFIGEMLAALEAPQGTSELYRWANDQYQMGWKSRGQMDLRRAWLRSAGFVRLESNRLHRTPAGSAFLNLVVVEPPLADRDTTPPVPPARTAPPEDADPYEGPLVDEPVPHDEQPSQEGGSVAALAGRIVAASTDTSNPAQFESVVCEAFAFLGFEAEHLGGSGNTDVLLKARLGLAASYRVTVDAKTTSSPALQDQQVDWVTLSEHRAKHKADYSMLVGPNPSTRRLLNRAQQQGVAVLSSDALADLCLRHAAQPLGLADYKSMFQSGGTVDLAHIKEKSNEAERLVALARRLLDVIGEEAERFGPVIARDLHRGLARDEGDIVATESEIQSLLHTLASPLVGAIQGDAEAGYVPACSPAVTAERLRILGAVLSDD